MQKLLINRCIKEFVFSIFFLFYCLNLRSTHAAGVDITYKCIGSNKYEITLRLYRDCGGAALLGKFQQILYKSDLCRVGEQSLNLNRVSVRNVNEILCPSSANQTICNSFGYLPGFEEHIYKATLILPMNCSDWILWLGVTARNGSITNLIDPGNQSLYTEVLINNSNNICNNSVAFTSLPVVYLCNDNFSNYNHGIIEKDGDSLSFEMIVPKGASGMPIIYSQGFDVLNPFSTVNGLNFDNSNGQISFTPNGIQRPVVTIKISEYDSLGSLKGYQIRDIQIVILNCPDNNIPTLSGMDSIQDKFCDTIFIRDSIEFSIYSADDNSQDSLYVDWNHGIDSGRFTIIQSGRKQHAQFFWKPTVNDIGTHFFTVKVSDNFCPIIGTSIYSYKIVVLPIPKCLDTVFSNPNAISSFDFHYTREKNVFSYFITFLNNSDSADRFKWIINDSIYSNDIDYTHNFDVKNGLNYKIQLIANNRHNCPDTSNACISLIDSKDIYVPNSFTPNGDGINDIFYPVFRGYKTSTDYLFMIFNHWGEIIFETMDSNKGWDGTYQSKQCQEGVYIWEIRNFNKVNTGHITLLR